MKKRFSATLDARVIHRPTKRLGQNFLVNQNVVQRILAAVNPHPEETIVEIGPGKAH